MSDLESLRKKISEEEARLARVEKERTEALAKLHELKGRLAVEDSAPTLPKPVPSDRLPSPSQAPASPRAFPPVTDQVVLDHLQGRHVIGVYPLLPDETCFFLAADFDGPSWQEDVAAFVATCRRIGVPPAVERSRSGKGAHTWFFFSGPIAASAARRMGCHLLTETMPY